MTTPCACQSVDGAGYGAGHGAAADRRRSARPAFAGDRVAPARLQGDVATTG
jgi:hypothetical protein